MIRYGFALGSVVCWVGYNLGAWCSFFVARYTFRDWFTERTQGNIYVEAIRIAVSPIPRQYVFILFVAQTTHTHTSFA